jgi:hypothetical protein
MPRVPILCRWLLNATAPIVPLGVREEWRREWYGELWHFIDSRIKSGDREAYRIAISHCMGAIADAIYLRRNDEGSRAAVSKVTRHPAFYVAPMTLAVVLLALLTNGFENTRRMIRPLPYRAPEQIVVLRQVNPFTGVRFGLPLGKIPGWHKAQTLDGVAAYAGYHVLLDVQGVREVNAAAVDAEFFQVLSTKAQLGQLFHELDPKACVDCAVISDEVWRSAFRTDPGVIGRSYSIAGRPHKIIGVLPRDFWFFSDSPAVWTLIEHSGFLHSNDVLVYAIARLRPTVTDRASLFELRTLYRTLPPYIKAREIEIRRLTGLTQDPPYRMLPMVLAGILLIASAAVILAPKRRTKLRGAAYFAVKVSLTSLASTLAAIELAYAPGMRMSGVRGFGPEAISLWLIIFGVVIAMWWAVDDQRKRCPACLGRLSMPVQMGARGHVLMEWMSIEMVCSNGHGIRWAPEDSLESHPKDKWLQLDESWQDLFAVQDKD